ncbi:DUF1129 family protein [Macrococcoides canis]|uniref:DUF1129 family protein n=1 Tax=Macrococcoides canis TaxID=1855823 RepID=UPI001AEC0E1D|nr:DUF1129 family protein [Macrococcus canis]QTQ08156.1 DUF1129 family protein [Macrococcus canis]UTH02495.1 DUF1129 family protein [Macrococcus canis]
MNNLDYMQKIKYLNSNNKSAFMEVANYVRNSYTKSENDAHIILSDMLDHLIEAQDNGALTEDFFGNDYRLFAQEITEELPKSSPNKLLYHILFIALLNIGTIASVYGISDFVKLLITGTTFKVPIVSLIISILTFISAVSLMTFFMITSAKNNKVNSLKTKVTIYIITFIMIAVPISFFIFFPIGSSVGFSYYYTIPTGIILLILSIHYYKKISG